MKNAQHVISTQHLLVVGFKRIALSPEFPVSVNDLNAIYPNQSPGRHLPLTALHHAIGQQVLYLFP